MHRSLPLGPQVYHKPSPSRPSRDPWTWPKYDERRAHATSLAKQQLGKQQTFERDFFSDRPFAYYRLFPPPRCASCASPPGTALALPCLEVSERTSTLPDPKVHTGYVAQCIPPPSTPPPFLLWSLCLANVVRRNEPWQHSAILCTVHLCQQDWTTMKGSPPCPVCLSISMP